MRTQSSISPIYPKRADAVTLDGGVTYRPIVGGIVQRAILRLRHEALLRAQAIYCGIEPNEPDDNFNPTYILNHESKI